MAGSSPLTRGKPETLRCDRHRDGLIPAHAGKTARGAGRSTLWAAHPRSRGENLVPAGRMVIGGGSSPLTRGKRESARLDAVEARLIPAHAGKTRMYRTECRSDTAHPRSRGENVNTVTKARAIEGSSPLTRGKQVIGLDEVTPKRLIPAHAGKTACHVIGRP